MKYKIQVCKPEGSVTIDGVMFKGFLVETELTKSMLEDILRPLAKKGYRVYVYTGQKKLSKYTPVTLEELLIEIPKVRFYGREYNVIAKNTWKEVFRFSINDVLNIRFWNSTDRPEYRLRTFFKFTSIDSTVKADIDGIINDNLLGLASQYCPTKCQSDDVLWMYGNLRVEKYDNVANTWDKYILFEESVEYTHEITTVELLYIYNKERCNASPLVLTFNN